MPHTLRRDTMSRESAPAGRGEIARFVEILRRWKWLVLIVVVTITAAAAAVSYLSAPVYRSSSRVLITNTDIPLAVAGVANATPPRDPVRVAATEAEVVRLRPVITRAREAVGITDESVDTIRDHTSVDVGLDSDILSIHVTDGNAARAVALADAVAAAYVGYRTELDVAKIKSARADILAQIDDLRASGTASGAYFDSLQTNAQRLATLATVGASNYNVVEQADEATKVGPKPVRDGVVALLVGLVVGIAFALLADRLDRRVRSVAEIEELLGASLLARVDGGSIKVGGGRRAVAALDRPQGSAAESFRMLRANFTFANTVTNAAVIMVTSARPGEGKSTTAANLAATLATAGRRVVLVDLDIRRPTIHSFFGISQIPGATQVAAGTADLRDVMVRVDLPRPSEAVGGRVPDDDDLEGRLLVVPAGVQPPNPGQFIASRAVESLIAQLRTLGETIIVDVPPLLACGDAKSLAPSVDGMLLVVRSSDATRQVLEELGREVQATPAPVLGFVAVGSVPPVGYGYYVDDKSSGATPPPGRSSLRIPS